MGTAVVGLVLLAAVAAIIRGIVKGKRNGSTSCGGNCAHCGKAACASQKCGSQVVTVLEIDGMMCAMCESHINDAIRNRFPVRSVRASHKTGRAEVVSDAALDEAALRSAIEQTGYRLTSVSVH